jgi:hypothetical protein
MVLAPECDGPDGALDRVIVEFNPAVIKEAGERWPAGERIADCLGEAAAGRNAAELSVSSQGRIASRSGRDRASRTCRRSSAVRPWRDLSIA